MRAVILLAHRELQEGLRNRWVLSATLTLGGLALVLVLLGSAPGGPTRINPFVVAVVNLSSLGVYLVPLIALMLSFDGIVGEQERGTLGLLLSYPVRRWHLVAGKLLGELLVLAGAVLAGYGAAGAWIALTAGDLSGWQAYVRLLGSSIVLGAVFAALGTLVSTWVRERATAIAASVGLWLALVVLYDLALLALLVADEAQRLPPALLSTLVLANPTDAYRIVNLTGPGVGGVVGLDAIARAHSLGLREGMAVLILWLAASGAGSVWLFRRREI